jgi:hypothetical protein
MKKRGEKERKIHIKDTRQSVRERERDRETEK